MMRYDTKALTDTVTALFRQAGLVEDRARTMAEVLVEGDLLGHDTHGLALLGPYLDALASGDMAADGLPGLVASTPVTETWDGKKLPGPWLVRRAIAVAQARATIFGLSAVVIRRSHHIACLAAYPEAVARAGQVLVLASSDPGTASVAPTGGLTSVMTPNPLAAGWPTAGGPPVIMDVSMSYTTNGMTNRLKAAGSRFPHAFLQDAQGNPTDDAAVFGAGGTLLPLGAPGAGHKGFALGLLVEMLTSALGGQGRADAPTGWGAAVFVLVLDPARFGGVDAFSREAGWLADTVRANPAPEGQPPPRLPGERGLARKAAALAGGLTLHASLPAMLAARCAAAKIAAPIPL
ncbi:Ldh family oxidoreductase [Humitalea sp. 24SJ18S-53]|uniref:Ldh family oxidoreductase n=1 Tax=Humitalea sp. 24SJ18S-53 TaxID=3422307 RepID=UPI003D66780D